MKLTTLIMVLVTAAVNAAPNLVNHQGRIAVSGHNFDGIGYFKFALVDSTGAETVWSNDASPAGEPESAVPVVVKNGHYATLLGVSNPLSAGIFANKEDLRLRVWFSPDGAAFSLLSPDRRLTPAPYAFVAELAQGLQPGYDSGSAADLSGVSIDGAGNFVIDSNYSQPFAGVPEVSLASGWSVTNRDSDGFQASSVFSATTIDSAGAKASFNSLAVIGGRPAIAYRDDSTGDLLFVRATNRTGTVWEEDQILRIAGNGLPDVGYYVSLADINGRPAVAFYDGGEGDLSYVRAVDSNGGSWPTATLVDGTTENVGRFASLAFIAGRPAISYTAPNTGELRFAEALDPDGQSWQTGVVEGALDDYRSFSSLLEVEGEPAIATVDTTAGELRFVRRSAGVWLGASIDQHGGAEPSMANIGGRPAVAYRSTTGEIKYVRAGDTTGSSWGDSETVAAAGNTPSLVDLGGLPAIAFSNASGELCLALGPAWEKTLITTGADPSLAIVDGLPALAFRKEGALDLRYASLPPAQWTATLGDAVPILASGVKKSAVTADMLSEELSAELAAKDRKIAALEERILALEQIIRGSAQ